MATTTQVPCPHCQKRCGKSHDTRPGKKRDRALRGHQVERILLKRRSRCLRCRKSFTERDKACGWRRKTTVRLREEIGKRAFTQPVAHVAKAAGVDPRFVEECFQTVALQTIERKGLSMDEHLPLRTRKKGNHCWKANSLSLCEHKKSSQRNKHKSARTLESTFPSWRWHGSSSRSYVPGMLLLP